MDSGAALAGKTVLVVDDDEHYLRVVQRACRSASRDLNVVMRRDGLEALAHLESNSVDMVVMDVHMPNMSGVEACQKAKEIREQFVVLVSAHMSAETRTSVMAAGADLAVPKPYNVAALLEKRLPIVVPAEAPVPAFGADHIAMAKNIARRLGRRYGTLLSDDDIEGLALLGLCEAARRYDSSKNGLFIAYAGSRIRGAILDEVRTASGRATREQVGSADDAPADLVCAAPVASERLERAQAYDELSRARNELSPLEAEVIRRHYDEDQSLSSIARELKLSEGKVLLAHSTGLKSLRSAAGVETAKRRRG